MNRYRQPGSSKDRRVPHGGRDIRQDAPHLAAYLARLNSRQVACPDQFPFKPADLVKSTDVSEIVAEAQEEVIVPAKTAIAVSAKEQNNSAQKNISLRIWGYYFAAKLVLFGLELIGLHPLENLVFALFVLWLPLSRFWRGIKEAVSVMIAFALLYYDSWLPPITRVIEKASSLANFTPSYLLELSTRFVSFPVIVWILAVWLVYWIVSKWINVGLLIVVGMLMFGLGQSPLGDFAAEIFRANKPVTTAEKFNAEISRPDMDQVLKIFFDTEESRSVFLPVPDTKDLPFDVIFIHICSLSWDDLRAVSMDQHPLLKDFDILLTRFNTAASYSGPAAIHLMRATCGQQEHEKMYSDAPDGCYLMSNLRHSGYVPNLAMNHNGQFDDFLGQVQKYGRLNIPPMSQDGLDIALNSFYGTPVYDDYSLLTRWLSNRNQSADERVALYYDTVTMHDGNFQPGKESVPNTPENYKSRLVRFLANIEKFMQSLEKSGRRAVVVVIPDHGASLRGDKMQIAGLREIPTPSIARVPVGIKVIGGQRAGNQLLVHQPTSYLAVAHILSGMLGKSPYAKDRFDPAAYVVGLPVTQFVAQSEIATVIEHENHYYLRRGSGDWKDYAEFNIPAR